MVEGNNVVQMAKANGVRQYGHVLRRDDGHVLRKALEFEVKGNRKRGPTLTFLASPVTLNLFDNPACMVSVSVKLYSA